ncbi:hypothetical protein TEA_010853 [Camellia sinensis var. sinensis]|uniref:Uncharacterized protein n=1 Tax=Camellia sinensis var. sinensis TaxID=542762 RepID=A0A4S4EPB9_CAMSN|nr:hypothetical protein TEA_010853 [Camellia sinensis var. sinensis]
MGGGAMATPPVGAMIGGGGVPSDHRTIQRPTTTNLHSHLPSSSSSSSHLNQPLSSSTRFEPMDGRDDHKTTIRTHSSHYGSVFGSVPSRTEVQKAISDLQRFMHGFCSPEYEWLHQILHLYDPRMLKSLGYYGRVDDAFRLLQSEPSVQVTPFTLFNTLNHERMVTSISSDKAVWDAILNNEAVQNLQESLYTAKEERPQSSSVESDLATLLVNWILDITKAIVLEIIEKFSSLVNKIFQLPEKKEINAEITDQLDDKLISSLLLSILILLIVVVTRAHGA